MKTHLLDKNCSVNLFIPSEEMKNVSKCGKEMPEYAITTLKHEVSCKSCLKSISK